MNNPTLEKLRDSIELLAEGELSRPERDQLFSQLDHVEDGWKSATLALLESQAIHCSMRQFAIEPPSSNRNRPDLFVDAMASHDSEPSASKHVTPRWQAPRVTRWFAWVAVSCLMLVFGYLMGYQSNDQVTNQRPPGEPNKMVDADHPIRQQLAANDSALMAQLRLDTGGIADGRVIAFLGTTENNRPKIYPIIESENLANQLGDLEAPKLSKQATEELKKQGWSVRGNKQVVAIERQDGTKTTYPIGMLNYKYVGTETF